MRGGAQHDGLRLITDVQSNTGRQSVGSSSAGDKSAAVRPVVSFSISGIWWEIDVALIFLGTVLVGMFAGFFVTGCSLGLLL